jgi:hypothetical protein
MNLSASTFLEHLIRQLKNLIFSCRFCFALKTGEKILITFVILLAQNTTTSLELLYSLEPTRRGKLLALSSSC